MQPGKRVHCTNKTRKEQAISRLCSFLLRFGTPDAVFSSSAPRQAVGQHRELLLRTDRQGYPRRLLDAGRPDGREADGVTAGRQDLRPPARPVAVAGRRQAHHLIREAGEVAGGEGSLHLGCRSVVRAEPARYGRRGGQAEHLALERRILSMNSPQKKEPRTDGGRLAFREGPWYKITRSLFRGPWRGHPVGQGWGAG